MKGEYFLNRKKYRHEKLFIEHVDIVQISKKLFLLLTNFLFFIRF